MLADEKSKFWRLRLYIFEMRKVDMCYHQRLPQPIMITLIVNILIALFFEVTQNDEIHNV